ncbi:PREDICTED: ankyrin-3-like [Priapulus caudatus]|uniref:Ankyrin-3-like n=1 Tax=Priapulus caudatus TaxID=37621 RepID=A0ABM1F4K7_PRICU|nr:PREDICTED: ankyrin-3-like [Priapulus caudatus]
MYRSAGRIAFMKESKVGKGEPAQTPICNLNIRLPDEVPSKGRVVTDTITLEKKYPYLEELGTVRGETITKADIRLSDIARLLGSDWVLLAQQLDISESQIGELRAEYPDDEEAQALNMLHLWFVQKKDQATGNKLEKALRIIDRDDIVQKCMHNVEVVTDQLEKAAAKVQMDQSGEQRDEETIFETAEFLKIHAGQSKERKI